MRSCWQFGTLGRVDSPRFEKSLTVYLTKKPELQSALHETHQAEPSPNTPSTSHNSLHRTPSSSTTHTSISVLKSSKQVRRTLVRKGITTVEELSSLPDWKIWDAQHIRLNEMARSGKSSISTWLEESETTESVSFPRPETSTLPLARAGSSKASPQSSRPKASPDTKSQQRDSLHASSSTPLEV